jgi:zinc transport system ATP-binding protein
MLEVNNISISLTNQLILENIDFKINDDNYLSIVGPNGSGKSTLLKTILGLIKPIKGYIEPELESKDIGYVPQIKSLDRNFPAKVEELVASGLKNQWIGFLSKKNRLKVNEALDFTGAAKLYGRSVNELSGGELQRVYLAKSIIHKPKILLLDEPATGIDLVCEKDISKNILEYRKAYKALVITVTHDLTAAYEHTDYTLMINKNQIFFGRTKEAFTEENLQATFSHFGHSHGYKLGIVKNA